MGRGKAQVRAECAAEGEGSGGGSGGGRWGEKYEAGAGSCHSRDSGREEAPPLASPSLLFLGTCSSLFPTQISVG